MTFFADIYTIYIRSIKQAWRPLASLIPPFFIPIFFFTVNSSAFKAVSQLPGFTAGSYLQFQAPVALFMSVFFSSGNAGIELVLDMSTGFFDKLLISPIQRLAIILGKLLAVGTQGVLQGFVVLMIMLIIGVKVETGFFGALLILLFAGLFAMSWSSIGMTLALMTKNARLVQSLFVIFFPFLWITTMQMPKQLLSGWFKVAVTINPVTYVLEGIRTLMIKGFDHTVLLQATFAVFGMAIVLISIVLFSFRRAVR